MYLKIMEKNIYYSAKINFILKTFVFICSSQLYNLKIYFLVKDLESIRYHPKVKSKILTLEPSFSNLRISFLK